MQTARLLFMGTRLILPQIKLYSDTALTLKSLTGAHRIDVCTQCMHSKSIFGSITTYILSFLFWFPLLSLMSRFSWTIKRTPKRRTGCWLRCRASPSWARSRASPHKVPFTCAHDLSVVDSFVFVRIIQPKNVVQSIHSMIRNFFVPACARRDA